MAIYILFIFVKGTSANSAMVGSAGGTTAAHVSYGHALVGSWALPLVTLPEISLAQ
jgi:hypothetical protein